MREVKIARVRLMLTLVVALGCSAASFSGTLTALGAVKPVPPALAPMPL